MLGCIFGDDELNYENYKFFLRLFDFVVVYLDEYAKKYQRLCATNFFVQGNCYSEANRIAPSEQENKIAFVGSPFEKRVELIRSLLARDVSIDIYGPPKRWRKYPDLLSHFKGYMDAEKFFETLNSYAFTYSSIIDMNGEKHMNTRYGKAFVPALSWWNTMMLLKSNLFVGRSATRVCFGFRY